MTLKTTKKSLAELTTEMQNMYDMQADHNERELQHLEETTNNLNPTPYNIDSAHTNHLDAQQ